MLGIILKAWDMYGLTFWLSLGFVLLCPRPKQSNAGDAKMQADGIQIMRQYRGKFVFTRDVSDFGMMEQEFYLRAGYGNIASNPPEGWV